MNILVIGGGISSERDISLRSARAVEAAAKELGYTVEIYDWDGSEDWLRSNATRFTIILPILHGNGGEDGQIQSLLEELNVSFLGSGSIASKTCFDKLAARNQIQSAGLRVASGGLVDYSTYKTHHLFDKPHVLKPAEGGSSIDTFIFPDLTKRDLNQIERAFERHNKLLLEEYIQGIEITVPILEGVDLPVIEIVPPDNGVFDYDNKYNGQSRELCPPQHVGHDLQLQASKVAAQIHELFGCRDLSRTDIIIDGSELVVLEINTMPGMTEQSLFPLAARTAGLSMKQLVGHYIDLVRRHG